MDWAVHLGGLTQGLEQVSAEPVFGQMSLSDVAGEADHFS